MKLTRQAAARHTARMAQWLMALGVCVALDGCASSAPRPASTTPEAAASGATAPAAAADPVQRSRAYQHAEALYLSGHFKEASAAFGELTRAYPRDAHVWLKYGNALTREGSYDDAASAFQTALTLDPTQGAPAINLALVRLGQAQSALEVAAARLPENSPEYLQAQGLQRQIKTLLDAPAGRAAAPPSSAAAH
jgi:TolA-binding protein